ncbi:MBL fold metallo-hydrolase [candidate division KSB1 bacterium]|nr:MBL fold metallo-hydrolase [candidate division KSB1 bacterium]
MSQDSIISSGIDTLQAQTEQPPLKLIYIANMGVLLNSGNNKILIDGLFKSLHPNCVNPSPETVEQIMTGNIPYEGVDLILITHKDQDHFNPDLTFNYMIKHLEVIVVMPVDAMELMKKTGFEIARVEKRILSVNLKLGESVKERISGVSLTIMRTRHGTSNFPMNLMYFIEFSGWRVFHEGDGPGKPEDYQVFGIEKNQIDLGIVQYSWPFHPHIPYRNYFKNELQIDHIALAHINVNESKKAEGKVAVVSKKYKNIFPLLPGMLEKTFHK